MSVNVLTATASDLRKLLDAGEVTSVQLVKLYLEQIAKHNHQGRKLNAVIETAPVDRVLEEASTLDAERAARGPRSNLHGIPILVKDMICTPTFGMGTTAGSLALKGLNASEDAPIAIQLREAGCIIIGKANMTEWCSVHGVEVTGGGSAVGGQTQSPYVEGGWNPKDKWLGHSNPAGSSSGSAVAVAAGFAPWAIGTDANGSIVQPAIRAAAYGLKITVGDVDMKGTQSDGASIGSAGPIAKSTEDCIDILDVLVPGRDFRSQLLESWHGIRIAYIDYKTWQFPDSVCAKTPAFDEQHEREMKEALKKIESLGASVDHDAVLMNVPEIVEKYRTVTTEELGGKQVALVIKKFLGLFDNPKMRTVHDLIQFNKEHASQELPPDRPNQKGLENALKTKMTDDEYAEKLSHLRKSVRHAIDVCLEASNADVIVASGETLLPINTAYAGYPIGCVPLGFSDYNGRPFGMEIMARNGEEEKILQVMSLWEKTFLSARRPPVLE